MLVYMAPPQLTITTRSSLFRLDLKQFQQVLLVRRIPMRLLVKLREARETTKVMRHQNRYFGLVALRSQPTWRRRSIMAMTEASTTGTTTTGAAGATTQGATPATTPATTIPLFPGTEALPRSRATQLHRGLFLRCACQGPLQGLSLRRATRAAVTSRDGAQEAPLQHGALIITRMDMAFLTRLRGDMTRKKSCPTSLEFLLLLHCRWPFQIRCVILAAAHMPIIFKFRK